MNIVEARDAMLGVFKAYWDTTGFSVVYGDVPAPSTPAAVWARADVKHALRKQGSLSGALDTMVYESNGLVFIEIYAPIGDGGKQAYALAEGVVNAFEDAHLDIWFRNVRAIEVGTEGAYYQVNAIAEFNYDTVR